MRPRRLFMLATVFALVAGCVQLMGDAKRTLTWDLKSKKNGQQSHTDFKASMEVLSRWKIAFSINQVEKPDAAVRVEKKPVSPNLPKRIARRRHAVAQR